MSVLLLDESSMVDVVAWQSICNILSILQDNRQGRGPDHLGCVHLILFGDLKQLPPATSQAPFIVDPFVWGFDFRILIQNRRVVEDASRRDELESFHETLNDISAGAATTRVRKFLIECYVRGSQVGADNVELEGSTAVFTKRRRDAQMP